MNLSLVLISFILFVAQTQSQGECPGSVSPADPNCYHEADEGHTYRPSCRRNTNNHMWHYDPMSGNCRRLSYKGCGGNKNRFCSRMECLNECSRVNKFRKL